MYRTLIIAITAAVLVLACNGSVQSPKSQVKQCLFDTECMSSQRCSREKDNVMGVCVDKVAALPADASTTTTTGADPVQPAPAPAPAPGPAPAPVQPQPGDIQL